MKKLIVPILILSCLALSNCESEPVTGSEEVIEINSVEFTTDTAYVFGNDYRAEGTVKNIGSSAITPIWYLEGSFFRDPEGTFKMGGGNTSYTFSLAPGQLTGWQITFRNSQYPASENPDFSIGELRVYKNDEGSGD